MESKDLACSRLSFLPSMPTQSTYTPLFDAEEDSTSRTEAKDSDGIPLKPLASTSAASPSRRRRDSLVDTSDNNDSDDDGEEEFGLMDRRRRSRSVDAGEGKEEDIEPLFRQSCEGVDDALAMVRSVSRVSLRCLLAPLYPRLLELSLAPVLMDEVPAA